MGPLPLIPFQENQSFSSFFFFFFPLDQLTSGFISYIDPYIEPPFLVYFVIYIVFPFSVSLTFFPPFIIFGILNEVSFVYIYSALLFLVS